MTFNKFSRGSSTPPSSSPPAPREPVPDVVVLFGWVGASMRHVAKYAELLLDLGVPEVWAAIASRGDVFLRNRVALPRLAEAALLKLETEAPHKAAAVFCFSNGGAMVYQYLWAALAADASAPAGTPRRFPRVRLVGAAFDSAPAALTVRSGSHALADSIASPWRRALVWWTAYVFVLPLLALLFFPGGNRPYFDALLADTLPHPQLFIYSETDTTTDARALDGFVAERRRRHPRGEAAVRALFIPAREGPSPHVGHLRAHPQAYTAAVRGFLADAMAAAATTSGGSGAGTQ